MTEAVDRDGDVDQTDFAHFQLCMSGYGVIQNNVANASTPGYASARVNMVALPFDPAGGQSGGVVAGRLQSSRDHPNASSHAVEPPRGLRRERQSRRRATA